MAKQEVDYAALLDEANGKVKELEKNVKELEKKLEQVPTPEAVYSFSTVSLSKDGLGATWTIRARHGEAGQEFFHRADNFIQYAIQHGWAVPQKPQQAQPAANTATVSEPHAKPVVVDLPPGTDLTIPCKTLSATVADGKTYWKIKGGKFEKFGVAIYPEVLMAAGFHDLDPMSTYDMAGWTASVFYNEQGKPQKIIKLAK